MAAAHMLESKVAIVTGSGGEISCAITRRFAEDAAAVPISDINLKMTAAAEAIGSEATFTTSADMLTDKNYMAINRTTTKLV